MHQVIKVREVIASKFYLLKIALSSLVRIIWAESTKKRRRIQPVYFTSPGIKCSIPYKYRFWADFRFRGFELPAPRPPRQNPAPANS